MFEEYLFHTPDVFVLFCFEMKFCSVAQAGLQNSSEPPTFASQVLGTCWLSLAGCVVKNETKAGGKLLLFYFSFFLLLFCLFETRSHICSPGYPGIHCVAEAGPELLILFILPAKCLDYRHATMLLF